MYKIPLKKSKIKLILKWNEVKSKPKSKSQIWLHFCLMVFLFLGQLMLCNSSYQQECQPHPCSVCWGRWLFRLCGSSAATTPGVGSRGPCPLWARPRAGSDGSKRDADCSEWAQADIILLELYWDQDSYKNKEKWTLNGGACPFQAPGTFGSPRMAMPTESFLFWPPLRFLAWAVMIFSKSRSFSTLVTY